MNCLCKETQEKEKFLSVFSVTCLAIASKVLLKNTIEQGMNHSARDSARKT
jgi:hypothetical protein